MPAAAPPSPVRQARIWSWRRIRFAFLVALPFGLLVSLWSQSPALLWVVRALIVSFIALLAFGVSEQWPARLPGWIARWVLQLLAVVIAIPIGVAAAHWLSLPWGLQTRPEQLRFLTLCFLGILFGPWIALVAMVRQREAMAHQQALSFQLERSELQRQALETRLRLLQSQVQPHFLFNTLANIRALVRAASPRAPAVLDSLIAYLRAALPRLDESATTVGQEVELVRAYLELMQMRMPDRLQFSLCADEGARPLRCPPMALLTLVENAVRHGIDPSEEGGRIDVAVTLNDTHCLARVTDTGVGLSHDGSAPGTGLSTLRERLHLSFGHEARLSVSGHRPRGVRAEIEFPAQVHAQPAGPAQKEAA